MEVARRRERRRK